MYINICIHIYFCSKVCCINTYLYVYRNVYYKHILHMYINTCMHICFFSWVVCMKMSLSIYKRILLLSGAEKSVAYIYIHIYICLFKNRVLNSEIYICIHTCTYTRIYQDICTIHSIYIIIHTYIHVYKSSHIYTTYAHIYMYVCMHIHKYTCMHQFIIICACKHLFVKIHMYIYADIYT